MDRFLFSFITASVSALLWPTLLPLWTTVLLLILGLVLLRKSALLSGCCFGIFWMLSLGHCINSTQPKPALFLQPVTVIGEIGSVLVANEKLKFDLYVSHLYPSEYPEESHIEPFNAKVRLSWLQPSIVLKDGQQVQLQVKLKPRWGLSNEAGFNYQTWLFAENIVATGYVKSSAHNKVLQAQASIRQGIADKLTDISKPEVRWLLALAIGYRGLLEPDDWALLQQTGTAHLVAISGMHLGMIALWSYLFSCLLCLLWNATFPRFFLTNLRVVGLTASLIFSFVYLSLADFAVPTMRAWLMLLLAWSLVISGSHWQTRRFILFSLAMFILLFPRSLFSLSFWLSFSAILVLWFLFWRYPLNNQGFKPKLIYFVKLQLGISVLMLPGLLWQFDGLSTIAPLINLIAIPFVTFVLLPASLLATVATVLNLPFASELLTFTLEMFADSESLLKDIAGFSTAWLHLHLVSGVSAGFLLLLILALMIPKGILPKPMYLLFILPFCTEFKKAKSDYWQADVLDVGNGLAVLLRSNERAVLYDTAASYPDGFTIADAVILPVLRKANIDRIDKLIISHADNDHIGGLEAILNELQASELSVAKGDCQRGMLWHWQGIKFEVLWPDYNYPGLLVEDNNQSCVIMLDDGRHRLLLPGDIEAKVEMLLAEWHKNGEIDMRADVLVAPHHGSKSSSSGAFVLAVSPQYVVSSTGFMNRWGMPADVVKKRYQKVSAHHYNTAESGQISVRFHKEEVLQVLSWRNDIQPRWYLRD